MIQPVTSLRSLGKDSPCAKKTENPDYTCTVDLNTENQLVWLFVLFLNYRILNMDSYLMTRTWFFRKDLTDISLHMTNDALQMVWRSESPFSYIRKHKPVSKHLFCNIYMHKTLNYLNKFHPAIHQTCSVFTLGWVFNHIPSASYFKPHIIVIVLWNMTLLVHMT